MNKATVCDLIGLEILDQIIRTVYRMFEESKGNAQWPIWNKGTRANVISSATNHALKSLLSDVPGVFLSSKYSSLRCYINGTVIQFKKLSKKSGKMPHSKTYRARRFFETQLSLIDLAEFYPLRDSNNRPTPIVIGYHTDDAFTQLRGVELVCPQLKLRISLDRPPAIIKRFSDINKQPVSTTKVTAKPQVKKERTKYHDSQQQTERDIQN